MKKCIEPKIGEMLHAHELGMLSDEDRARFEMHLMECDYCFEQARSFIAEAEQLKGRPEMSEAIRGIIERQPAAEPPLRAERKRWPKVIPVLAVAAVVLIILILQPGKFEIQYSDEAIAHENRLAVMYFDNLADPQDSQKLGEIATNLLIADLAESRYMQVVSSQRLYDLMRLQGHEEKKAVDKEIAANVAKKARARWILSGSIMQIEPRLELSTQLVDASTGDVIASQAISGREDEDIFSLIDDLTDEIKHDMSLPAKAYEERDPDVAEMTSHSEEAYRLYLVGLDYRAKLYVEDARKAFREALAIDSTMAMAYYHLTWLVAGADLNEAIDKAAAFSDRVGWKDKNYILARKAYLTGDYQESIIILRKILKRYPDEKEAYFQIGNCFRYGLVQNDSVITYMEKAINLDSLYGLAHNFLAYTYNEMGEVDKAIEYVDQYIAVAPGEANPYDSKAEILKNNGRIPEAIDAFEKAVAIKPDLYYSIKDLGILCIFDRQYEKAHQNFQILASGANAGYRSVGRRFLPYVPLYQGKFDQALEILDDAFAVDRIEQSERPMATILKMSMQLHIYYQKGDYKTGLTHCMRVMDVYRQANPNSIIYMRDMYIHFLVAQGELNQAKLIADEIRTDIEARDREQMDHYWYVMGVIKFAEKEFDAAVEYFLRAYEVRKDPTNYRRFVTNYWLARSYQEAGHSENAVAIYESLLNTYDEYRLFWATASVNSYYQLGRAYEAMGRTDDAIIQYREFIDIWENADNGRALIDDARRRISDLSG
jgi:tetratricopeptide (TPR) repeat protein